MMVAESLASYSISSDLCLVPSNPTHRSAPVSSSFRRYVAAGRAASTRDSVRLPLQTVAAVLLAYAWMSWQDLPEITWGTFSALFVVRASVEGTVGEAVTRVLGAFMGVALGVSLVLLSLAMDVASQWSVVFGVGAAAYLSTRWPALSYSLVTVTIFTVVPDDDILSGAIDKSLAIVIGSISGIIAAVVVLPLSARSSMRFNVAASIEIYGELLVEWAAALHEGRRRPDASERPALARTRWRATDMAQQSRSFPMYLLKRKPSTTVFNHLEGLWRTVPVMERVGGVDLSDKICRRLGPTLDQVARAAKEQIEALAQAVREGNDTAPECRTREPFSRLNQVIECARRERALDSAELESVELIRWAWHEVTTELDRLCDYIGKAGTAR